MRNLFAFSTCRPITVYSCIIFGGSILDRKIYIFAQIVKEHESLDPSTALCFKLLISPPLTGVLIFLLCALFGSETSWAPRTTRKLQIKIFQLNIIGEVDHSFAMIFQ
jgi:hypothetical protein